MQPKGENGCGAGLGEAAATVRWESDVRDTCREFACFGIGSSLVEYSYRIGYGVSVVPTIVS